MAKKSMIAREKKRFKMCELYSHRRQLFKEQRRIAKTLKEKITFVNILDKFPKNSSAVRLTRRCLITGRPKGVYRRFGLSRQVFREMAHQCLLPGVTKSSW